MNTSYTYRISYYSSYIFAVIFFKVNCSYIFESKLIFFKVNCLVVIFLKVNCFSQNVSKSRSNTKFLKNSGYSNKKNYLSV